MLVPYTKAGLLGALLALLLTLFTSTSEGNMDPEMEVVNISAILNQFMVGYDKRVRPNYGGISVTVGVSLYILSIGDLSEKFMDFTFDMYFRQFWHDPRLAFEKRPNLNKLVVGAEYIKLIWVPDTFFVNEKVALFHQATTENQFLRIMPSGDVLRSIRLTIKATCPLDLQYFPMDKQMCTLEIESFGYTMSDLKFRWEDGSKSVQMSPDVSLPQFDVLGHRQRIVEASLSSGNYSRLLADIQFDRAIGYYVIQVYIPSSLIVVMSWVSFWLNRGAAPARVGLGVTTVLTMTTLMASVNAALPKISYMKSIDIYLGVCFFMVFGALIEYACVGYTAKRIQLRKNRFLAVQKLAEEKKAEALKQMNSLPQELDLKRHGPDGYGHGCREVRGMPPNSSRGMGGRDAHPKQATVRLHSCCMMTCTLNGGPDVPPDTRVDMDSQRRIPGCNECPSRGAPPPPPPAVPIPQPPPERICGMRASDIDKYSRIIFPITFISFHMMYWSIFLTISETVVDDLVYLQ